MNLVRARELVNLMLGEQEAQGNPRDYTIFYKELEQGATAGGFTWEDTEDGQEYWEEIIQGDDREAIQFVLNEMFLQDNPPTETFIINNETFIV